MSPLHVTPVLAADLVQSARDLTEGTDLHSLEQLGEHIPAARGDRLQLA